jgi:regulator of replication initiation timing
LSENIDNLKKDIKKLQNKLNDLNIRVHKIIQENEADKLNGTEKDQEQDSNIITLEESVKSLQEQGKVSPEL